MGFFSVSKTFRSNIVKSEYSDVKVDYTPGKELGKGRFSVTKECIDKKTNEECACKSIAKRYINTPENAAEVKKEVAILNHLKGYPGVIELKKVYEDKHFVHLILELCAGGELFDRIAARGHYSERSASKIVQELVQVVAHIHSRGVVHRDLKPENFLMADRRERAHVKLIDFGSAVFGNKGDVFHERHGTPYYMAPEVVKGQYGRECDVWSIGVILYLMLSGVPPFWGETDAQTFYKIQHSEPDFLSDPWPQISRSAKELIGRMLKRNPKERITADEALTHPWLVGAESLPDAPLNKVVQKLRSFSASNDMKKIALRVIACSLSRSEIMHLKKLFLETDRDGSGSITYDELREGLRKAGNRMPEEQLKKLMQAADSDHSGSIDYTEFLTATIQLNQAHTEEQLWTAFQHFDTDGSGTITMQELREALDEQGMLDPGEVESIIAEVDKDGDGKINYEEFVEMMRTSASAKLT